MDDELGRLSSDRSQSALPRRRRIAPGDRRTRVLPRTVSLRTADGSSGEPVTVDARDTILQADPRSFNGETHLGDPVAQRLIDPGVGQRYCVLVWSPLTRGSHRVDSSNAINWKPLVKELTRRSRTDHQIRRKTARLAECPGSAVPALSPCSGCAGYLPRCVARTRAGFVQARSSRLGRVFDTSEASGEVA